MASGARGRRTGRWRALVSSCGLSGLVLCASSGSAAPAHDVGEPSRPTSYALEWNAPPECPSHATITRDIEALLGVSEDADGELTVRARVELDDGTYVLRWSTEFQGHVDVREPSRSTRCRDLGDVVALTVALALEPEGSAGATTSSDRASDSLVPPPDDRDTNTRAMQQGSPAQPESQVTRDPVGPARLPSDTTSARTRPPRQFDLVLRLAPLVAVGALPRVAGGLQGSIGLRWRRFGLELFGLHLWPRRNRSETGSFQLGVAGSRACGWLGRRSWSVPICGGFEAGVLRADARRLIAPRVVHAPWAAGLVGSGFAIRGSRLGFWSLAEGAFAVQRPQFRVGDAIVFRSAAVHLRLCAGLEYFF